MEGFRIYLYDKNGKMTGIFLAPSKKEFEVDKLKYCSEYREGENFISYMEIKNPIVENGKIREMNISEQVQAGIVALSDGSYLDEENETIVTIAKPNEWSIWDKDSHTWKVDNNLSNKKLKELREKALKDLAEAKLNFLNQSLEIEKNGKKYTFENNEENRNRLALKFSLVIQKYEDKEPNTEPIVPKCNTYKYIVLNTTFPTNKKIILYKVASGCPIPFLIELKIAVKKRNGITKEYSPK